MVLFDYLEHLSAFDFVEEDEKVEKEVVGEAALVKVLVFYQKVYGLRFALIEILR